MLDRFPDLDLLFVESGGDNLAGHFSVQSWLMSQFMSSMCLEVIKFLVREARE